MHCSSVCLPCSPSALLARILPPRQTSARCGASIWRRAAVLNGNCPPVLIPCRQGQGAVLPAGGARGGRHSPGLQVSTASARCTVVELLCRWPLLFAALEADGMHQGNRRACVCRLGLASWICARLAVSSSWRKRAPTKPASPERVLPVARKSSVTCRWLQPPAARSHLQPHTACLPAGLPSWASSIQ